MGCYLVAIWQTGGNHSQAVDIINEYGSVDKKKKKKKEKQVEQKLGGRGRGREWATLEVHPLSWLLSNNPLEKVPFESVPHTSSNRLLLSNQDKGCTPSFAHSLALPLGPALLNLWNVMLAWCFALQLSHGDNRPNMCSLSLVLPRGVVSLWPHTNAKESDPGHQGHFFYILCGHFDEKQKQNKKKNKKNGYTLRLGMVSRQSSKVATSKYFKSPFWKISAWYGAKTFRTC